MNQPEMFSSPLKPWQRSPPHNGAPTSKAAADSIRPCAGTLRALVLEALRNAQDGLTDEECQDMLSMPGSTQRPRRGELEAAGLVIASERTRATRSGRQAVVYIATPITP